MTSCFKVIALVAMSCGIAVILYALKEWTYPSSDLGGIERLFGFGVIFLGLSVGLYRHARWAAIGFSLVGLGGSAHFSQVAWLAVKNGSASFFLASVAVAAICVVPAWATLRFWRALSSRVR